MFLLIFLYFSILIWNPPLEETQNLEFYLSNFFLLEIFMKIIVFGPKPYFYNKWNFIDFLIVASIFLHHILQISGLCSLIFLRNFIILRLIKLPSFTIILEKLSYFFGILFHTFLLIIILLFMCSLVGVQLFSGLLKYRCMNITTGHYWQQLSCGAALCPLNHECVKSLNNPDSGVTNYDNILFGLLQTLRLITMDNWTDLQHLLQDGFSQNVWVYTVIIVVCGNFLVMNLILTVLKVKYTECDMNALKEIKNFMLEDKEKTYRLDELREKGIYFRDNVTGIRQIKINGKVATTGKRLTKPSRSFQRKDRINPQNFLKSVKKNFGLINRNKIQSLVKNSINPDKKESIGLYNKTMEIRIDKTMIYTFCDSSEVIN